MLEEKAETRRKRKTGEVPITTRLKTRLVGEAHCTHRARPLGLPRRFHRREAARLARSSLVSLRLSPTRALLTLQQPAMLLTLMERVQSSQVVRDSPSSSEHLVFARVVDMSHLDGRFHPPRRSDTRSQSSRHALGHHSQDGGHPNLGFFFFFFFF